MHTGPEDVASAADAEMPDEMIHIYNLKAGFSQNQQDRCNKLKQPKVTPSRYEKGTNPCMH
jgi:hypothetical protein